MRHCIGLFFLCVCGLLRGENATPLRWGEFGFLGKWYRPSYEIKSDYPYLSHLPTLDQFPELLKLADDPRWTPIDKEALLRQLATLSRCDFTPQGLTLVNMEKDYKPSIDRWKEWWNRVGQDMAVKLKAQGCIYPEAWKFVAYSPYLECPSYPLLLPEAWSFRLKFRSGDYGGCLQEILVMKVTPHGASLERFYQKGWPQSAPWTAETWQGFDRKEAQFFLAAIIYAVDNPWLLGSDHLFADTASNGVADPKVVVKRWHVEKRPEAWSDYYPGVTWSGILDTQGHVILNDDPDHWFTGQPGDIKYEDVSLNGGLGVVYRLLLKRYPDPSWDEEASRWKKREVKPEEFEDLQQVK